MSSAAQNRHIARIIVGAMTIDGSLSKEERKKVAKTLENIGMGELIADVGAAIEEEDGSFSVFEEVKELMDLLGAEASYLTPLIFRCVCDVVASDRFVSEREASYLSALAKRLGISVSNSKKIFTQVLADRRSRLEVSGKQVDGQLNPQLKELLSFQGADKLVGEVDKDSIDELIHNTDELVDVSHDELLRALTVLGLDGNAKLEDAETVWKETIDNLNLPKMANLGETFVSAAINRITRINEAYKTVLQFFETINQGKDASQALTAKDMGY